MPRYYEPISDETFSEKVLKLLGGDDDDPCHFWDAITKDLKVSFDYENFNDGRDKKGFGPKSLLGYRKHSNGLQTWGMCAGGDWEHPVFFCLYWDGKKVRAYVPTFGNPWNTATKEAYGNDEAADLKNARKRCPGTFDDVDSIDSTDFEFDESLIEADILERITLKPEKTKPKEPTPVPATATNTYKIVVGDWSEDGHNQWQFIFFRCNKTQEEIRKAYLDAVMAAGVALSSSDGFNEPWPESVTSVLTDFEENTMADEEKALFSKIGIDVEQLRKGDEDTFTPEDVGRLFFAMVASQLPGFEYETFSEETPCINGFWQKGFNLSLGYGVFNP